MYNYLTIAKKICELSKWDASNLELQKMMYIVHMMYYGEKERKLSNCVFEAWKYGPVTNKLYSLCSRYGSDSVGSIVFYDVDEKLEKDDSDFIENIYFKLLENKTPQELLNYVHNKNGAWYKVYSKDNSGRAIIDYNLILQEYNNLKNDRGQQC